tara:strand:+ start:40 stop:258 length:219 start_codon:yes stop_codon:yes gene_type:complete
MSYAFLFNKAIRKIKILLNIQFFPNKMGKTNTKTIEKEKIVAESLNGRFAIMGFIAPVGAHLTAAKIIHGLI